MGFADHVGAGLGRWDFRRRTSSFWFSACRNSHEREQTPTGGLCEPVRVTSIRNETKRGAVVKKRDFPKVVEATGYIPSHKQVKKGYMLTRL